MLIAVLASLWLIACSVSHFTSDTAAAFALYLK